MAAEVKVLNPKYWGSRSAQLARMLASTTSGAIPDPAATGPDPDAVATVSDPSYWATVPAELADALSGTAAERGPLQRSPTSGAPGVATEYGARLTMSVEEAAKALGISRALAYEAVSRNEIPHIRIGRRILIPRSRLRQLLDRPPE